MAEVSTTKYKRKDVEGGFLTNPSDIAFYRTVQKNEVIDNHLLGDFNEKGNYILKKSIIEELLNMTKVMQYSYGKMTFCTSINKMASYGNLEFVVKVATNKPTKGQATATLELLEPINKVNGYYQNTNVSLIATYTDKADNKFIAKVAYVFNMITADQVGKFNKEETIAEIIARKDYLEAIKRISDTPMSKVEKDFYERRIKALMTSKVGKEVLKQLDIEVKKLTNFFLTPDSPHYYKVMNELLNKVLEQQEALLKKDPELVQKLHEEHEVYVKETEEVIEHAKVEYEEAQKTESKKQVAKKQIEEQEEVEKGSQKQATAKLESNYFEEKSKEEFAPTLAGKAVSNEQPSKRLAADVSNDPKIEDKVKIDEGESLSDTSENLVEEVKIEVDASEAKNRKIDDFTNDFAAEEVKYGEAAKEASDNKEEQKTEKKAVKVSMDDLDLDFEQ